MTHDYLTRNMHSGKPVECNINLDRAIERADALASRLGTRLEIVCHGEVVHETASVRGMG